MNKISDERLEKLLDTYYRAEPEFIPVFNAAEASVEPYSPSYKRRALAAAALVLAIIAGAAAFSVLNRPSVQKSTDPLPSTAAVQPASSSVTETLTPTEMSSVAAAAPDETAVSPAPSSAAVPNRSDISADSSAAYPPGTIYTPESERRDTAAETAPASVIEDTEPLSVTEATHQPEDHTETRGEQPTAEPVTEPTTPDITYPTEGERELAPTAQWVEYLSHQSVYGVLQSSLLTGSGRVYFRIYAFDGSSLGDPELLSESNLAYTEDNMYGTVTASYYLGSLDSELSRIRRGDCLRYSFFNEDGEVVLSRIKIF